MSSASVVLEWDPPDSQFLPASIAVTSYLVYVRPHGSSTWRIFAQVPARPHPQLVVKRSDLGNGNYDFGVSSVNAMGFESTLHTSLDTSADPVGGWYLIWSGR